MNAAQKLASLTLPQLKEIAKAHNLRPSGDKRRRQTWIDAIEALCQELCQPEQPQAIELVPVQPQVEAEETQPQEVQAEVTTPDSLILDALIQAAMSRGYAQREAETLASRVIEMKNAGRYDEAYAKFIERIAA